MSGTSSEQWATLLRGLGSSASVEQAVSFALERPDFAEEMLAATVFHLMVMCQPKPVQRRPAGTGSWRPPAARDAPCLAAQLFSPIHSLRPVSQERKADSRVRILAVVDGICTRAAAAPAAAETGETSCESGRPAFIKALCSYLPRMLEALLDSGAARGSAQAVPCARDKGVHGRVRNILARWEKKGIFAVEELLRPRELLEAAESAARVASAGRRDAGAACAATGPTVGVASCAAVGPTRSSSRRASGPGCGPQGGAAASVAASGGESEGHISLPPTPVEPPKGERESGSSAPAPPATPAVPVPAAAEAGAARFKKMVEAERAENKRKKIEARLRPEGETTEQESAAAWEAMPSPRDDEIFVLQVLATPYGSCYELAPYWSLSKVPSAHAHTPWPGSSPMPPCPQPAHPAVHTLHTLVISAPRAGDP